MGPWGPDNLGYSGFNAASIVDPSLLGHRINNIHSGLLLVAGVQDAWIKRISFPCSPAARAGEGNTSLFQLENHPRPDHINSRARGAKITVSLSATPATVAEYRC